MGGPQETRKRQSRPARRGRKLILVSSRPTPSWRVLFNPVLGEYEKAAEEAQKTIELAPDFGIGYAHLGYNSFTLTVWEMPKTLLGEPRSEKSKSLC